MILTKTNLCQQHASNWKFTKLHFFLLHLFPFTEQTLIKLWQKSMKLKISLFSWIFPSKVVNKNRFKESKEFFYSIILFNFPRRSYVLHSLPWIWSKKQVRCFAHWLNGCWLIQGSGCTFSGNNNVLEKQRCQNHISTRYLQDRNRIYLLDIWFDIS